MTVADAGEGVLDVDPALRTKLVMLAVGGVGVRGFVTTVARAPVTLEAINTHDLVLNPRDIYGNSSD